jgi:hypothetical protein
MVELRTESDGALVTLEIVENGTPLAYIQFDAVGLDDLFDRLAELRAGLSEPVTPRLDPGSRLLAFYDPAWNVAPDQEGRGQILALRHAGKGWCSFLLPQGEADSISLLLRSLPRKE